MSDTQNENGLRAIQITAPFPPKIRLQSQIIHSLPVLVALTRDRTKILLVALAPLLLIKFLIKFEFQQLFPYRMH